jgi:hypothetical protein
MFAAKFKSEHVDKFMKFIRIVPNVDWNQSPPLHMDTPATRLLLHHGIAHRPLMPLMHHTR